MTRNKDGSKSRIRDGIIEGKSVKQKKSAIQKMQPAGNSRNPLIRYALIILIVLVLGAFATIIYYYNFYVLDYREIAVSVRVAKNVAGFNTSTEALNFGKISPGSAGTRYFHIRSGITEHIKIVAYGELAKYLTLSDYNFMTEPNITKTIIVNLGIPENMPEGNYSGKIKVYFFRS